jgi:hypothetical protein
MACPSPRGGGTPIASPQQNSTPNRAQNQADKRYPLFEGGVSLFEAIRQDKRRAD